MNFTPESKRKPEEDMNQYLIRLGENLELYDLTWSQAAQLLNEHVEDEFSETKWRKDFSSYVRWKDYLTEKLSNGDEFLNEVNDKLLEFQKEKYKYQDQKREYNAAVRQQARFEHLKEEIHKSIQELARVKPLVFIKPEVSPSPIRANVLWSDWHYGMDFSNSLNTFNRDVFRQRLEELVSKTIAYCNKHNVDALTIGALGDFIGGAIHVSTRVQASEDVIRQLKYVAECLSESVAEISKHVRFVKFINIIGNHARLIPNKTESIFTENLENLIPWYMEVRLKDFKNIDLHQDQDGYFVDETFEPCHVYVHGDLDHVSSVAKSLPQVLGVVPRYIYCGHIHHDTVKEYGRTKVISNGSLIGVDDYAMSKRFYAEPMQKMHVFNDRDKIEYTIDIGLS